MRSLLILAFGAFLSAQTLGTITKTTTTTVTAVAGCPRSSRGSARLSPTRSPPPHQTHVFRMKCYRPQGRSACFQFREFLLIRHQDHALGITPEAQLQILAAVNFNRNYVATVEIYHVDSLGAFPTTCKSKAAKASAAERKRQGIQPAFLRKVK